MRIVAGAVNFFGNQLYQARRIFAQAVVAINSPGMIYRISCGCATANERHCKLESSSAIVTISFDNILGPDESIASIVSITEAGSSDLSITLKQVNSIVIDDDGVELAIGKAAQAFVAGGVVALGKSSNSYRINALVMTDSTPQQQRGGNIELLVYPG